MGFCLAALVRFGTEQLWLSLALGGGIGALYHAASYLTYRRAARYEDARFLKVFMGGLLVRMAVALLLVVVVLTQVSVQRAAFVLALLATLFAGIFAEVLRLHRRMLTTRRGGAASAVPPARPHTTEQRKP